MHKTHRSYYKDKCEICYTTKKSELKKPCTASDLTRQQFDCEHEWDRVYPSPSQEEIDKIDKYALTWGGPKTCTKCGKHVVETCTIGPKVEKPSSVIIMTV